jgi:hypothetical protein
MKSKGSCTVGYLDERLSFLGRTFSGISKRTSKTSHRDISERETFSHSDLQTV